MRAAVVSDVARFAYIMYLCVVFERYARSPGLSQFFLSIQNCSSLVVSSFAFRSNATRCICFALSCTLSMATCTLPPVLACAVQQVQRSWSTTVSEPTWTGFRTIGSMAKTGTHRSQVELSSCTCARLSLACAHRNSPTLPSFPLPNPIL